jgi:DnaK suppressor protein
MLRKLTTSATHKNSEHAPDSEEPMAPAEAEPGVEANEAPEAETAHKAKAAVKVGAPEKAHPKAEPGKAPAAKAKAAPKPVAAKPKAEREEFLATQRQLLLDERANYLRSADVLKAQADSLALEHEPGDVQFDEEGGEGGTSNVDRELDLVLSAQARAAAIEIDRALAKIDAGTYGLCEQCGQPIPDARLQALPQAALCVACKSGGLSSRR